MLSLKTILFPTDFSQACFDTAPYAAGLARKFGSKVILLHASLINRGMPYAGLPVGVDGRAFEATIQEHRLQELRAHAETYFQDLEVSCKFDFGEPADAIVSCAEDNAVDLIVMPTHGHGTFRKLLVGSITTKVLHDTSKPVWTTAHTETLQGQPCQSLHTIVCAVDLSPESLRVVRAACDIAGKYGSHILLVHAIPLPEFQPYELDRDAPFQQFLFETANEKLTALQRQAGTHFDVCVKHATPARLVQEVACNSGAGLTVVGRGHSTKLLGTLRTHMTAIVKTSPCPVLSV